jgi:mono/diheme cytochrome c family protein
MRNVFVTLVGLAIATSVVAAQTPDPAKVAAGLKVYTDQKCATCHAIKGQGGKLASALDGVGGKLSAADIKKWLTTPAEMEAKLTTKPKMPMSTAMKSKKMSDADVDALTAYMLSLK